MVRNSRSSTWVALVAGVALALGLASSAGAVSSLSLVWKSTGTATVGNTTSAPPPSLTASMVLVGDSTGIAGVFVSFIFDYIDTAGTTTTHGGVYVADGDELNSRNAGNGFPAFEMNARVSMGNVFAPLTIGTTLTQDSNGSVHGEIIKFDSTVGTSTGCISCTVTLGTVLFTTTASTPTTPGPT